MGDVLHAHAFARVRSQWHPRMDRKRHCSGCRDRADRFCRDADPTTLRMSMGREAA